MTTPTDKPDFTDCQTILDAFFAKHPNDDLRAKSIGC